eukprot:NODE_80_length_22829_cov_0.188121.p10 type:complete len:126 gc:universal NODE_80_length_22829_cov_0.188121:14313-13936(-)
MILHRMIPQGKESLDDIRSISIRLHSTPEEPDMQPEGFNRLSSRLDRVDSQFEEQRSDVATLQYQLNWMSPTREGRIPHITDQLQNNSYSGLTNLTVSTSARNNRRQSLSSCYDNSCDVESPISR